jgi:uncharacterized protein
LVRVYWRAAHKAWQWSRHVYRLNPNSLRLFKRHLRWATAAALRPQEALDWFSFHDEPAIRGFSHANPRLVFRALTRYMSVRWGLAHRTKVIQDTYRFIVNQGGFLEKAMQCPEGMSLARLDLDRGQKALIRIGSDAQFRKEGEISVFLELAGVDGPVTGMAFSLEQDREWIALVGGFQGRKGGDEETIKLATKAMHGLRPKSLMVLLIQELARTLGISSLRGVGNSIQVFRARMSNPLVPARNIRFDFDALWTEVDGKPRDDGWFELPLTTPRRNADQVKPNKRSMYAKRYLLMDDLSRQIRKNLTPDSRQG